MVLYSGTIAYACVWVAHGLRDDGRPPASMAFLGLLLAWGQWLAAVLDGVEDAALGVILSNRATAPWPQVARWCAIVKFALVILGIVYAMLGGTWVVISSARGRGQGEE